MAATLVPPDPAALSPGTTSPSRTGAAPLAALRERVRVIEGTAAGRTAGFVRFGTPAVDRAPLAGLRSRADIVFTRRRIAIYLDGCFWHACPAHGVTPKAHAEFWTQKLARNRQRDTETSRVLTEAGWAVLRFWEHEDTASVVAAIESVVHQRDVLPGRPREVVATPAP